MKMIDIATAGTFCLLLVAGTAPAAQLQGYLADWKCVKKMVKNGQEQTLKNDKTCSLQNNYQRHAYGLITDDKKFYRLDEAGNKHALEILPKSPSRDSLHVIVTGDIKGNLIKVAEMSIL